MLPADRLIAIESSSGPVQPGEAVMKSVADASIKRRLVLCLAVLSIISVVQVATASFLQYTLYRNSQAQQVLN
ncbi:hypothetical protein ABTM68_20665, partial [Acinetobacter baumannii]